MNNCPIGVFDSGVGGTTVLKKLIDILPNEDYIYFADSLNAPYGERTKEEIIALSIKIGDFLLEHGCKVIVIACNTITAAALETMKKKYSIPVLGIVESAARITVSSTKNKNVGVLATPFTVSTNVYEKEIKCIDSSINIFQVGCKEFCSMIEGVWESYDNRLELLKSYITKFEDKNIDTLVLGCTHYPIIRSDIERYVNVNILDPADNMSKEIKFYLEKNKILNDNNKQGSVIYHVSGSVQKFKSIVSSFFNQSIENVVNTVL